MPDGDVVLMMRASLVSPVLDGVAGRCERAAQVHLDHGVPFLDRHVDEHAVAQDAGIVHQHVDRPEGVDRRLDEAPRPVVVRDVVAVGDGLAPHGADLVDHFAGRPRRGAAPVHLAAEVVDHDLGALAGVEQGVLTADATARSSDDDDPTVTDTHVVQLLWCLVSYRPRRSGTARVASA
jgi:hypothetical protein